MHGAELSRSELNEKTRQIMQAALKVHSWLGPGLLESAYHTCLAYELRKRNFAVAEQHPVSLSYEDLRIDIAYRADLIVDGAIVVELKAVGALSKVHEAQLQTHLNLGEFRVGLLFNFHEARLRDGIRRRVNRF